MTERSLLELLQPFASVLELLAFRALPCLAFILFTARASGRAKLSVAVLYALLVLLLSRLHVAIHQLAAGALALLWCAAMALVVYRLRDLLGERVLSRPALFLLCVFGFQFIPGLLAPPELLVAALVLGWEMTLSAYSYAVDTVSLARRPRARDCVFFIVINPTLVFVDRGKELGSPELNGRGVARVLFGLATLMSHRWVTSLPASRAPLVVPAAARRYLAWLWTYGSRLLAVALAHSGLASVQIGLLRLLGWRIPERYRFPLLAPSPLQFWRRWNIWIGRWAQRYVFTPLALRQQRRLRGAPPLLAKGVAALVTFAAVGLLHDAFFYFRALQAGGGEGLRWTGGFALFGLLFILAVGLSSALPRLVPWLDRTASASFRPLRAAASWLLFMHCMLCVIWAVDPSVTGALVFGR